MCWERACAPKISSLCLWKAEAKEHHLASSKNAEPLQYNEEFGTLAATTTTSEPITGTQPQPEHSSMIADAITLAPWAAEGVL